MPLENLSDGLPDEWVQRVFDFEPFNQWTERRVAPVAYRAARAAVVVQVATVMLDAVVFGTTSIYVAALPWHLAALVATVLMTAALGVAHPLAWRAPATLSSGMAAQAILVYINLGIHDRLYVVPFIVLFFLFGVLLIAPILPLRLYAVCSSITVLSVGGLMVITGRSLPDFLSIGFIVLPALAFLGHVVRAQGQSARAMWELSRDNHLKSTIDGLSRVLNRRAWYERGTNLACTCGAATPLAFLMLDIDHFKRVNDTWGHECGDLVIRQVAEAIMAETRNGDIVGRLGGEEFGVLLPGASPDDARTAAERIRSRIEALRIDYRGETIPVTASLGCCVEAAQCNLDSVVRRGDACLYRAKNAGRNRVEADMPA